MMGLGLMLLPACSIRLPLNQSKRVDFDSNRRLGALASQIEKSMKSESSRMLSHVEISKIESRGTVRRHPEEGQAGPQ